MRLHSSRKETSIFVPNFTDLESHSVGTLVTTRTSSKSPSKESTRASKWNRKQICVPIFKSYRFRQPKRKRERLKQENLDHPDKQGPFSRGDPDEEDDDRDDDDEENDSKPPSIDRHQLSLRNNAQWSPTKTSSKKPGPKLPSLHP